MDSLIKLAVGRAPDSGRDLCFQPTMSRLERAPSRIKVGHLTGALVDIFCRSFPIPPAEITLDIDDIEPSHLGQKKTARDSVTHPGAARLRRQIRCPQPLGAAQDPQSQDPALRGTRTVTIQAGHSSATLTLATVNDSIDEPDGSVSATLAGGTGYTVGSPNAATVAVTGGDAGKITGAFFGDNQQRVGGTLRRQDLSAGFAGTRQ